VSYNADYSGPAMAENVEDGVRKGMTRRMNCELKGFFLVCRGRNEMAVLGTTKVLRE